MADPNEWQTQSCRQRMIDKIELTLKRTQLSKQNSCELEASVFQNSRNEEEYVSLVGQMISKMAVTGNGEEFGASLREAAFQLDPDSIHISHGSWGTVPQAVYNRQLHYNAMMEATPDRFFRQYVKQIYAENIEVVANFVGADPKNVVLVENATTAINTVLKCLPLKKGDGILIYTWTYGAIANAAQSTASYTGAKVEKVDLNIPLTSRQEVIDKYKECLQKNPHIKVAIIDYISSGTATLLPVAEIIELCRSHDVITIIDGAHTPGQLHLNVESLGCDFFTGNFHKWVFTPRGTALLWVSPKFHDVIRPLITSHFYKSSDWRTDFTPQSTRDYTPYLVVRDAIGFYKAIGGLEVIRAYTDSVLEKAVDYMVKELGTRKFPIPKDMEAPYMRIVELPRSKKYTPDNPDESFSDLDDLMDTFWERFKAEVTVYYVHGHPWIRLSCYVYNHLDDYIRITQCIKSLFKEGSEESE